MIYAAFIFCLFNTHYLAFGLGLALTILFIRESKIMTFKNGFALSVMGAGVALAFLQGYFIPAGHYSIGLVTKPQIHTAVLAATQAFIPAFWDISQWLAGVIVAVMFLSALAGFMKSPSIGWLAGVSYGWIFYVLIFRYTGDIRHYGLILVVFIFLFWLRIFYSDQTSLTRIERFFNFDFLKTAFVLVTIFLILSIRYSAATGALELSGLFSGSKAMAQAIDEISGRLVFFDEVIVAHPSPAASSVAAYLPKQKFWYADIEEFGTYIVSTEPLEKNQKITPEQVIIRAGEQFHDIAKVLFLLSRPLPFSQAFGYEFQLLFAVDKNVWGYGGEKYYLYKAIPLP